MEKGLLGRILKNYKKGQFSITTMGKAKLNLENKNQFEIPNYPTSPKHLWKILVQQSKKLVSCPLLLPCNNVVTFHWTTYKLPYNLTITTLQQASISQRSSQDVNQVKYIY